MRACVHRNIYVANGSPGINTQLEVRKTGWALTGLAYASLTVCFGKWMTIAHFMV